MKVSSDCAFVFERIRAFAATDGIRRRLPLTLVIEPIKGYKKEARRSAGWLAAQFGVMESPQHPFVEALARVGVAPTPFAKRSLSIDGVAPVGVILGRILSESWRVMCLHQQGVLKPDDTEYLHDYRVALRRSRSLLSQLRSAFPAVEHKRFRKAFKRIGDRTGSVRDLDVHLLELETQIREESRGGVERIEPLRAVLQRRWKTAQRKLARELKSERYALLATEWPAFLVNAPAWQGEAQEPVLDAASSRIRATYAEVVARGSVIQSDTPDDALHELRLHCKKLRYLLEFFAPLYPAKQLDRFVATLKALQEILGDFNDLFVQRETLRGLLDTELSLPDTTREWMAEQAKQSLTLQAKARESFAEAFAELARSKTRKQVVKLFLADSLVELDRCIAGHVETERLAQVIPADAPGDALDDSDIEGGFTELDNEIVTEVTSASVDAPRDKGPAS